MTHHNGEFLFSRFGGGPGAADLAIVGAQTGQLGGGDGTVAVVNSHVGGGDAGQGFVVAGKGADEHGQVVVGRLGGATGIAAAPGQPAQVGVDVLHRDGGEQLAPEAETADEGGQVLQAPEAADDGVAAEGDRLTGRLLGVAVEALQADLFEIEPDGAEQDGHHQDDAEIA